MVTTSPRGCTEPRLQAGSPSLTRIPCTSKRGPVNGTRSEPLRLELVIFQSISSLGSMRQYKRFMLIAVAAVACCFAGLIVSSFAVVALTFGTGTLFSKCVPGGTGTPTTSTGLSNPSVTVHIEGNGATVIGTCSTQSLWWVWIIPASGGTGLVAGGTGTALLLRRRRLRSVNSPSQPRSDDFSDPRPNPGYEAAR